MSTASLTPHSSHPTADAPDRASHPPGTPVAPRVRPDVLRFVDAHRRLGHRSAVLDPLQLARPHDTGLLAPACFGLSPSDPVTTDGSPLLGARDVRQLDARLKAIYCGTLALDVSALRDEARAGWLCARFERDAALTSPAASEAGIDLLDRLIGVEAWEHQVGARFPDAKRFSLEGCESLLPLLDALLGAAAAHGVDKVCMGMPHRGRVNVLVNLLGMPVADVLDHFAAEPHHPERQTDLIYHLGARHVVETPHGEVTVRLAPNPSHLQSVYPVVMGMAHALQTRRAGERGGVSGAAKVLPIVLHGDAAFAGQGVVMETLVLTQKPGYEVGGTVHVVINNQIGFTEPNPMDAERARYCTDVTRVVDAPVLRVNADAPEQVRRAAEIAIDYRAAFASDIVIDLIGYRRLGHSEHDLPAVTGPGVAALAARRPSVVDVHAAALVACGVASTQEIAERIAHGRAAARDEFEVAAARLSTFDVGSETAFDPLPDGTPLTREALLSTVAAMTSLPPGFEPHPFVADLIRRWGEAALGRAPVDWCFAEALACASVLSAGVPVRISGLDVQRGTFFHRHAVWHDQRPDEVGRRDREFVPLRQLADLDLGAARFEVVNSHLSEEAVLGFEYGRSVADQRGLSIWEAQFGDFVNGAQVYIDQYLATGEEKWGNRSALTLLLPHGYEGFGPEHSNAWLARFLQLCGADNLQVACPSTAAQMFHLLRRQAHAVTRKPLVVMTPKVTLYKEPGSHSPLEQLLQGGFEPLLDDAVTTPAEVTRVVVCSGKLFYDIDRARQADVAGSVAILRLEQLYPFPADALAQRLERFPRLQTLVWAQEETRNQGAWAFVRDALAIACPRGVAVECVARSVTAAGATSSATVHQRQQREVVDAALGVMRSPAARIT